MLLVHAVFAQQRVAFAAEAVHVAAGVHGAEGAPSCHHVLQEQLLQHARGVGVESPQLQVHLVAGAAEVVVAVEAVDGGLLALMAGACAHETVVFPRHLTPCPLQAQQEAIGAELLSPGVFGTLFVRHRHACAADQARDRPLAGTVDVLLKTRLAQPGAAKHLGFSESPFALRTLHAAELLMVETAGQECCEL